MESEHVDPREEDEQRRWKRLDFEIQMLHVQLNAREDEIGKLINRAKRVAEAAMKEPVYPDEPELPHYEEPPDLS